VEFVIYVMLTQYKHSSFIYEVQYKQTLWLINLRKPDNSRIHQLINL